MRVPRKPPEFSKLFSEWMKEEGDVTLLSKPENRDERYRHWDEMYHRRPPEGLKREEWWLATKFGRMDGRKMVALHDRDEQSFSYKVPEEALVMFHQIDLSMGGNLGSELEPLLNSEVNDRYLVSSLMEEAITSSQLEGAATTRQVAKEMIQSGRRPQDLGERMIYNNFLTMRRIRELKKEPLSVDLVFEIHRLVTDQTLEAEDGAGRFRRADEEIEVGNDEGDVFHRPPDAGELQDRMEAMCAFANGETPEHFVHPVARAVILHFWLAYDHPFVDGNGRTARALFYWAMLNQGYWLFEYVSISEIIRRAPVKYGRSFLYTETDDNDLTYFLLAQLRVIDQAIKSLGEYVTRKQREIADTASRIEMVDRLNHRQAAVIQHGIKYPDRSITIASHRMSHGVVYQTARKDLLEMADLGILVQTKRGNKMVFRPAPEMDQKLREIAEN